MDIPIELQESVRVMQRMADEGLRPSTILRWLESYKGNLSTITVVITLKAAYKVQNDAIRRVQMWEGLIGKEDVSIGDSELDKVLQPYLDE